MRCGDDGFTLLEVIILLAVSVVLMLPAYSYIANMSRLEAETLDRRKHTNRVYEIVEEVKAMETEELLSGVEYETGDLEVLAYAEYDIRFKESEEQKKRKNEHVFDYTKLDIYIEVCGKDGVLDEYTLTRVETGKGDEED